MCARWAHMELFLYTLRFLQPIFTYHIDPMCVPFTLHVPLVRQWNNSRRKTPWKIPPCPEVVPAFPRLRSGQWTYPPPLILTLPFSPKPTHMNPAHLIYSHLLMSNSCRVDSQRIAAITSSSPPSLLSFSQPFCVWPLISGHSWAQTWCHKPSIHSGFIYDLAARYDVMNLHRRCPWAEMNRQTAGYKLCVWIELDSYVLS